MTEASFASLGPTLLARKGGAKPAMRPQLAPLPENVGEEALEDLGWNDMGSEDEADEKANIVALNPGPVGEQAHSPVVKRQQKDLSERILADAVMDTPEKKAKTKKKAASKPKKKGKSAAVNGRRAAFTLRLDPDRHLKLRLAATMQGISAQAVVTEALDQMLDQIDGLDGLAERMKRN